MYSFLYTSEGGRTNPTATLHEGTGYHGSAGLTHELALWVVHAACVRSFSKRVEASQEACRRRGPGLVVARQEETVEIYTGDKEKGRAAGGVPGGSRPKPLLARTSARQQGGGSRTCITCDRRTVAWAPPFAAAFSAHLSGAVQVDTGLDRTPQAVQHCPNWRYSKPQKRRQMMEGGLVASSETPP